jgi:hypothetical protein
MALPITDEHGTVQVGQTIELPAREIVPTDRSTFINVFTSATETLFNLTPWRLLKVEPMGATIQISVSGHLPTHWYGVRALRVLHEAPAWQALGPQGKAVLNLVMRAGGCTAWQARELAAHWQLACHSIRDLANPERVVAVVDAGRVAACEAAQVCAVAAMRRAALHLPKAAQEAACEATRAAIDAEVIRDRLSPEAARALQQPWTRVFGSSPRAEHPA